MPVFNKIIISTVILITSATSFRFSAVFVPLRATNEQHCLGKNQFSCRANIHSRKSRSVVDTSSTISFTSSTTMVNTQEMSIDEVTKSSSEKPLTQIPEWCDERQIYINGVLPNETDEAEEYITSVLQSTNEGDNPKSLKLFGYGSLCWNPGGEDDTLSKSSEGVTSTLGCVVGWKRCWCQKSADHRGVSEFLGFVCTLLKDEEIESIIMERNQGIKGKENKKYGDNDDIEEEKDKETIKSMTEGLIYTVPPHLAKDCLDELNFREKGGYSLDVIDVIEVESGKSVKALLYRATPENPAFSTRALLDPHFTAATISVAIGPSGRNDEYLFNLDSFLSKVSIPRKTSQLQPPYNTVAAGTTTNVFEDSNKGDTLTKQLASMTREYKNHFHLYFLHGCGSNQHDQLLLEPSSRLNNAPNLINGDEAHNLTEIVLAVPTRTGASASPPQVKELFAGGGHSALLTENGDFYLWGWNAMSQLGQKDNKSSSSSPLALQEEMKVSGIGDFQIIKPLEGIKVDKAALGHGHTLVIEKETKFLYAFGDNGRKQLIDDRGEMPENSETKKFYHRPDISTHINRPTIPKALAGRRFAHVSAGLFHSAAITELGDLVTFGETKYGQCLGDAKVLWRPNDGSQLMKVCCGRRHTIILDEHGRVWTLGVDNKHGQLGRSVPDDLDKRLQPMLVKGILSEKGSGCIDIECGWSHNIAIIQQKGKGKVLYGWGRNDKGQLGSVFDGKPAVEEPQLLHESINGKPIRSVKCGSEFFIAATDDGIHSCGWGEHGNLSSGDTMDKEEPTLIKNCLRMRSSSTGNRSSAKDDDGVIISAGGAHFLAIRKS